MGIRLLDTNRQIHEKILTEIYVELIQAFGRLVNTLPSKLRPLLRAAIESQPAWQSLNGGTLMGHFGIPKNEINIRLEKILTTWLDSIRIRSTLTTNLTGGLLIEAIQSTYLDVLSLPASIVINTTRGKFQGERLTWLDWLLTKGDTTIINDYHVMEGDYSRNRRSRSGLAIMVPKGSWGVPSEFASRGEKNFVTDAVSSLVESLDFGNFLIKEIRRAL